MTQKPSLRVAVAGALALAAAMGIGRFAYTALLPGVQRGLGLGDAGAGVLASWNLAGYLAGVLVARRLAASPARVPALRAGLVVTALATALGAASATPEGWTVLRLAAGVASGLVFVLASAAALEAQTPRTGVLYSGVGAGIALSGTVAALLPESAWRTPWVLLGACAAVLALPGWRLLASPPPLRGAAAQARGPARARGGLGRLGTAYFLEGLGYIVSGTFLVAAVRRTPGLEPLAPWAWVLAGLAAVPSAPLWAAVGRRLGVLRALAIAHLVQAAGMALPALSSSALAAVLGAALWGGTFIGIVTLAMSAARALVPDAPGRAVGTLTALYGVGQILGPVLAGALARWRGDPRPAVLAAAAAVAAGALVLAWPARRAEDSTER